MSRQRDLLGGDVPCGVTMQIPRPSGAPKGRTVASFPPAHRVDCGQTRSPHSRSYAVRSDRHPSTHKRRRCGRSHQGDRPAGLIPLVEVLAVQSPQPFSASYVLDLRIDTPGARRNRLARQVNQNLGETRVDSQTLRDCPPLLASATISLTLKSSRQKTSGICLCVRLAVHEITST